MLSISLLITINLFSQDNSLKIHYTFKQSILDTVNDCSGNGCNATLNNGAIVKKRGNYDVLDLGRYKGYLDLGEKTVKSSKH